MSLSRRQFLNICGITFAASTLPRTPSLAASSPHTVGRVLNTTALYNAHHQPIGQLFPDTLVAVTGRDGELYRLHEGWVAAQAVQPMPSWGAAASRPTEYPAWVEAIAPVAVVRTYCSEDAPPLTRIGHGGVLKAVDWLPEGKEGWLAVRVANDTRTGWTRAGRWRALPHPLAGRPTISLLKAEIQQQRITAYGSTGQSLAAFEAMIPSQHAELKLVSRTPSTDQGDAAGIPWQITWEHDLVMRGVYWHNHFGSRAGLVEKAASVLELPAAAASWVYQHVRDDAALIIG